MTAVIRPSPLHSIRFAMSHHHFVHPLTDEERAALLAGETQARHRAERNRFRAVLLSAKSQTTAQIAALLDMGQSTVRAALKRFERAGPAALRERPRSGRPAKVPP